MPAKKLPRQTVANVFILMRVPAAGWLTYGELFKALEKDVAGAKENGFDFDSWSKVGLRAAVRFVIQRSLLSCEHAELVINGADPARLKDLKVSQNDRSKRYLNKVPRAIHTKMEKTPFSNVLLLLAGAAA